MDVLRDEFQDSGPPIRCAAARLFTDHGHRRSLVKESELSVRTLGIRRIHEDPPLEEGAVKVRDQGTDVARAVRLGLFSV